MEKDYIVKIFDIPIIGRILLKIAQNTGGGVFGGELLKRYAKARGVDAGLYTYGSCFTPGFSHGKRVRIGNYCSFAEQVRYFGANHPMRHISTSAFFYNKSFGYDVKDVERSELEIENDVWIGYGAIITSGCRKIHNGAVIGAGAVVTKDVGAYEIVAGNPAKRIRMRFDEATINMLETSKWWERTPEELMKFYEYMDNPQEFVKQMKIYYG